METNHQDIELIDAYLEGSLSDADADKFESRLKDYDFKNQVDTQKTIINEIKVDAFSKDVQIYLSDKKESKTFKLSPWLLSGLAASIIVILSTVYVFYQETDYYDQYFEPYPDLISSRAVSDNSMAMFYYGRGEYNKALAAFEEMNVLTIDEKFYLGITQLSTGNLDEARMNFTELLTTDWKPFAQWYLSLTLLKLEDYNNAIQSLIQITSEDFKYTEAQVILDEIKH